jgi:hypothetical protein
VIERVERIGAQLKVNSFRDRKDLRDVRIEVLDAR